MLTRFERSTNKLYLGLSVIELDGLRESHMRVYIKATAAQTGTMDICVMAGRTRHDIRQELGKIGLNAQTIPMSEKPVLHAKLPNNTVVIALTHADLNFLIEHPKQECHINGRIVAISFDIVLISGATVEDIMLGIVG